MHVLQVINRGHGTIIIKAKTCLIMCVAGAMGLSGPVSGSPALGLRPEGLIEPFSLPQWSGEVAFDLSDQSEGILVLDFFAYWCGPCLQASRDLEHNVNRYYESRDGNAHGMPVRVISINVEGKHPEKTEAFLDKAGARYVLDDPGGKILEELGGQALPYIVILKSSRNDSGVQWELAYQSSGYQGSEKVRSVIESIKRPESTPVPIDDRSETPPALTAEARQRNPIEQGPNQIPEVTEPLVPAPTESDSESSDPSDSIRASAPPPFQQMDEPEDNLAYTTDGDAPPPRPKGIAYTARFESLYSSDIFLFSADVLRRQAQESGYWDMWFSYGRIHIDYEPVPEADVIGEANRLEEPNAAFQLTKRFFRTPFLEFQISGGGYYGFTDPNSLWLDEYYRQQFSGLDGYVEAEPWGINLAAGFKWDSRSAAGILGLAAAFQQDDVAPGYDRPLFQPLERGEDRLYTGSLLFEQESIITRMVRVRNQFQLTQTTDRELRYSYNGNLNLAPVENWVIRLEGAATYEAVTEESESDFRSYSGGVTVEYDWDERWYLGLTGRKYRDNGQIETSILVSSGPPALETTHLGLSLRHQGEYSSWSLSLASYSTKYDEIDSPIRPFGNLYRDRDWISAAASFNHLF